MRSDNKYNPTTPPAAMVTKDRLGRILMQGDLVYLDFPNAQRPVFEIAAITPLLDPGAPAGMLKIECLQRFTVMGAAGGAAQEITRVAASAEVTRVHTSASEAPTMTPETDVDTAGMTPTAPEPPAAGPKLVEN